MSFSCCHLFSKENKQVKRAAKFLKTISEPNRLRILCMLINGELCVCELVENLDLPQNLVSHHLGVLKKSSLISDERRGQRVYYSLTKEGKDIEFLLKKLTKLRGMQALATSTRRKAG